MSSPRGFEAGGMGEIGTEELRFVARFGEGERRREDGDEGDGVDEGDGRGKRKEKGLNGSLERNGGWRTLRYMLKFRKARLAWGTYLLAYPTFSEYIPLMKNSAKVVTEMQSNPRAIYW